MNRTKAYFDSVAPIYTKRSQWGLGKWLRRRETAILLRFLGDGFLGDILELGSGSGYYSHHLQKQGCSSLTCVDFSSAMLEKLDVPGCVKVEADVQHFRSDRCFDTIFCAGALEFLERPESVFNNATQMIKPAGSLVIMMPRASFFGRLYQLFHEFHGIKIRLFTSQDLSHWAQNAGLAVIEYKRIPLFSIVAKLKLKKV